MQKNSSKNPTVVNTDYIVLGSGCFWGAEKRYQNLDGVVNAVSGYSDGSGVEPSYSAITKSKNKFNKDNHAEVVKVEFDPTKITVEEILKVFFESHDPTQVNRQGNDVGTQYRSIILVRNVAQASVAERLKLEYQKLLTKAGYGKIATTIKTLSKFYAAEEYHQDYLFKNPNGYCPIHSTGVKFDGVKATASKPFDNSKLLKGKHIIVLYSDDCPYCSKFKKDVTDSYKGDTPIHHRTESQLSGLHLKTETWATPTIYFLVNGHEIFAHQGYLNNKDFYKLLGEFELGKDSESFKVAFNASTDQRFCKKYNLFKNAHNGVFVDKLSGAPLFDTKDRFNSHTGWLSFTHPIEGSVTEHEDNSYGMHRIEIRSKSTGIHLGHVFDDGPNGNRRYCINATVLDFKAR